MANNDVIKAHSPARLAEEYIIRSIWNNHFPPGSDLPAERELADKIGVTRTTLREVLQRLARDGWLSIQHGKPTRVNNIWETSGLNILEALIKLDGTRVSTIIANILSARTNISAIYISKAFRIAKEESLAVFEPLARLKDTAEDYTSFDYELFRKLAFASNNPVYGLILNSLKSLYERVGRFYFSNALSRELALKFYYQLQSICQSGEIDQVRPCIRQYGIESGLIWSSMQQHLPENFNQ
ncbi:fatty acid metabolism transcriptional regulator FadR [Gallibacterium sp. AGMB14963]|uniref:fatty acid metabolism transcriptional regulator FadR n=1 Tax=Gallibacterium faecale TaxID=3019086 RepID=UPI0022F17646|nr:fatty acid metabolism transcriptional regulator FadR [Gallibacterium sp. AGMB14963]MDA3977618.1 fatty acid metabolism transcriptional regulator FadR [Gallibacterium sp. AGMB14963]